MQFNILIIDDDKTDQALYEAWIMRASTSHRYRCIKSKDVEQGKYLAVHENPDVILLDFMLLDDDGFSVLDFLKHHCDPLPRIIFITGYSNQAIKEDALACGALKFLCKKTLTPTKLMDAIEETLDLDPLIA